MNVLEIVKAVCGDFGLAQPNSLIGTSDIQTIQLRSLLDTEGSTLSKRSKSGWQALVREATFVTVAAEDQGTLTSIIGAPNAFRHILNETFWNRSTREPIYGPIGSGVWQGYKAFTFTGPYAEYRIRGDHLLLLPIPTAGHTCAFEYASKNWLTSADGLTQRSKVAADDDEPLLADEILKAGLSWRWKKAQGLDFGQEFEDYEAMVVDALAGDGTKPRLSLNDSNIPDDIPVAIPRVIGL